LRQYRGRPASHQGREAGLPFWAPVVVFIAWAVFSAYPQIKYMDDRLGETYARRSWAAPVLTALAIIIGVALAAAAAIGYAAAAAASGA